MSLSFFIQVLLTFSVIVGASAWVDLLVRYLFYKNLYKYWDKIFASHLKVTKLGCVNSCTNGLWFCLTSYTTKLKGFSCTNSFLHVWFWIREWLLVMPITFWKMFTREWQVAGPWEPLLLSRHYSQMILLWWHDQKMSDLHLHLLRNFTKIFRLSGKPGWWELSFQDIDLAFRQGFGM